MNFRFQPMTLAAAEQIRSWRYEAPYDFYDLDADLEDLAIFFDETRWPEASFTVRADDGEMVGQFSYDRQGTSANIGLGMSPRMTGLGLGTSFVAAGLEFGVGRWGIEQ